MNSTFRLFKLFLILAFTILVNSCGLKEQINKSVDDLTNAEKEINANASNAIDVLRSIKNDYPDEIRSIINNDVDRLVKTSISTTSAEARCDLDFVSKRLKAGLENTIRKLQNLLRVKENKPLLPMLSFKPSFCSITPEEIDLNEKNIKPLKIYGYDFEDVDSLKVETTSFDGRKNDITKFLAHTTDYMLTLRTDDPTIYTNFNQVNFEFAHSVLYSFLIIPQTPKICKEEDKDITAVPQVINFFANRVGTGDGDFGGDVRVGIGATLNISPDQKSIVCTIGFYADEVNGDTHGRYDGTQTVFTAPSGQKIKSINTPTKFSLAYTQSGNDPVEEAGNGFITRAVVRADHKGDDVPGYTGAELTINTIRVTLVDDDSGGSCIDKEAYIVAHPNITPLSSAVTVQLKAITLKESSLIQKIDNKK
jgi:hypothetical protein